MLIPVTIWVCWLHFSCSLSNITDFTATLSSWCFLQILCVLILLYNIEKLLTLRFFTRTNSINCLRKMQLMPVGRFPLFFPDVFLAGFTMILFLNRINCVIIVCTGYLLFKVWSNFFSYPISRDVAKYPLGLWMSPSFKPHSYILVCLGSLKCANSKYITLVSSDYRLHARKINSSALKNKIQTELWGLTADFKARSQKTKSEKYAFQVNADWVWLWDGIRN